MAEDPNVKLYSIGIEDFDHRLYEIVLPGRSHGHARGSARALLALTGPKAFKPFDLMAQEPEDLRAQYQNAGPTLLPQLFAAYDVLSQARADLGSETGLYALIEFQIEQARKIVRPSPAVLRNYLLQRGLTRLPPIVVSAHDRLRTPANAFQAASSLPRQTVSAARAFSQAIEQDAREIAALKVKIRAEHIQTRKNIAGLAKIRINELRTEIGRTFQPHYKQARLRPGPLSLPPQSTGLQRLDAIAQKVVLKATIKAHQLALRTRLKPALEEKRAALKRADELHARFERTDRALTVSSLEDLQRQWRALASGRMRQVHGPDAAPPQGEKGADFLSRLASRAGELRQQSPAPEQNRLPEPD